MSFPRFEYDENTLIEILEGSMKRAFRYQIKNNPRYGVHVDPAERERLDEGWKIANKLLHLDFAEDMGLMKSVAHSTKQNPLAFDINGEPICVSTYRMTVRGIRYLRYPKWRRWLAKNFHEINPLIAIIGLFIAWFSLLVSIWIPVISVWIGEPISQAAAALPVLELQ